MKDEFVQRLVDLVVSVGKYNLRETDSVKGTFILSKDGEKIYPVKDMDTGFYYFFAGDKGERYYMADIPQSWYDQRRKLFEDIEQEHVRKEREREELLKKLKKN